MNKILSIKPLYQTEENLNISWMLGKRCNYDCSYCTPQNHDLVSPFINIDSARNFIENLDLQLDNTLKKASWYFTGGEPFIDPSFEKILSCLYSSNNTIKIQSMTNGSLPLAVYVNACRYLTSLTFSLHFERSDSEILKIVDKISQLSQMALRNRLTEKIFLHVNVMFYHGKLPFIKQVLSELRKNKISYTVKRILPKSQDKAFTPFVNFEEKNKKDKILKVVDEQIILKENWKKFSTELLKEIYEDTDEYYSEEEIQFLLETAKTPGLKTIQVTYDNASTVKEHPDNLIKKLQNNFKGWRCYAGVRRIHIEFDGNIYVGNCLNGGSIGNIKNNHNFLLSEPVVCESSFCTSNLDVSIEKFSSSESN